MLNEPELPGMPEAPRTFMSELQSLLNRYSREGYSNTPDFVLARFIDGALRAFDSAVRDREDWYGRYGQYKTHGTQSGHMFTAPIVVPAMTEDAPSLTADTVICEGCDAEVARDRWPAHRCSIP